MKKFILFVWQFPQHLVALIMLNISRHKESIYLWKDYKEKDVYFLESFFRSGISLGNYIFLDKLYINDQYVIKHEYGHCKQSLYFGFFYLIIIGIPSLCNNIISRIMIKSYKWYYSRYPEKWADELGEVKRIYD